MQHRLISHSPDLKKLRDEGFEVEVKGTLLLVHNIPYVNSDRKIVRGTIVSKLDLVGDKTVQPQNHVAYFIGETPCHKDGSVIKGILSNSQNQVLTEGIEVNHIFSAKPINGQYENYYQKVVTYAGILYSPAQSINPSVTPKTFRVIESNDPDTVFNYLDTSSSRAEIDIISSKLQNLKIAIVGLGGTGSYVLDFVAKTWVKEIYLFDGDDFLQHNAFRTPGAASLEDLNKKPKKVHYLNETYSKMHKGIIPRETYLDSSNLEEISKMDFVFICIDHGEVKKLIIEKLTTTNVPFIDVGIGVEIVNNLLRGSVRVTTLTNEKNTHIANRVTFSNKGDDDYAQNIQIAELNALNAALAVIKWKKIFGYYHDLEKEHNTIYNIDVNQLVNDETVP